MAKVMKQNSQAARKGAAVNTIRLGESDITAKKSQEAALTGLRGGRAEE
ncbi:hypothetical protein CGLO_09988 [Colletotrichum gloeosporioides Cg-14]|uniref:Uncharacterized protein n=1 Tax=Colletotrichum gloeosporioides (strain Cg-14) TaxID=1237896 RepID=T0LG37_COLGC|nr:hypothetical protein CGLO_09988 [Colletotrichum gloeosporioides Cg-14]